jgi:hypothetical protein
MLVYESTTRVRLPCRDIGQARDEVAQDQDIDRHPDQQRDRQAQIRPRGDDEHAAEIHDHVEDDIQQLHHRLAHGERGLHHLGGDAAGEVVLEERQALAEQVAMRLPADDHGVVAQQGLMHDERVQQHGDGQGDQHGECRPQEAALRPEHLPPRGMRQPVDQIAEIAEQGDLQDRDQAGQHGHDRQMGLYPARVMAAEGEQTRRRQFGFLRRERPDQSFEKGKHQRQQSLGPSMRPDRTGTGEYEVLVRADGRPRRPGRFSPIWCLRGKRRPRRSVVTRYPLVRPAALRCRADVPAGQREIKTCHPRHSARRAEARVSRRPTVRPCTMMEKATTA